MAITVIEAVSIYAARDSFKALPPGVNIYQTEKYPEEKKAAKFVVKDGELIHKMKK